MQWQPHNYYAQWSIHLAQFCWLDGNVNIEHCQGSKCVYMFLYSLCWLSAPLSPCVPSLHFIHPASGAAYCAWMSCSARALDLRLLWKVTLGGCCKQDQSSHLGSWPAPLALPHTKDLECAAMRYCAGGLSPSHFQRVHTQSTKPDSRPDEAHAHVCVCVLRICVLLCCSLYPFLVLLMESDLKWAPGKLSNSYSTAYNFSSHLAVLRIQLCVAEF